jgi:hypothetical protein
MIGLELGDAGVTVMPPKKDLLLSLYIMIISAISILILAFTPLR